MHIRPDGRIQLDIHTEITTEDGKKVALAADGVLMGAPPVLELRENVTLTTSYPEYSWVNAIQIWGPGLPTSNLAIRYPVADRTRGKTMGQSDYGNAPDSAT